VIGETLQRATPEIAPADSEFLARLKARVADPTSTPPSSYQAFVSDPLSIWIEGTFGIFHDETTGRLRRRRPRSLTGKDGAGGDWPATGVSEDRTKQAIEQALLSGYTCERNPSGFPAFAFRLHQFISRGDTVYASFEPEASRYLTVNRQQFVPGDRKRLLPLRHTDPNILHPAGVVFGQSHENSHEPSRAARMAVWQSEGKVDMNRIVRISSMFPAPLLCLGLAVAQTEQGPPTSALIGRSVKAIGYQVDGGSTKVDLKSTQLMPQASGEAKVAAKKGITNIEVDIKALAPAGKLGTEFLTYVLWVVSPYGRNNTAEGRQKSRRVEIIVSGEVIGAKIGI
jgi:hypothetical protein